MRIRHETLLFPIIQSDITNYCNLRCKFCLTDFSNPAPKGDMQKAVFEKSTQLLPLAADNAFHFSCAFEPTLNPDFLDLLELFPPESRAKVLFTTNLAKKLSDEDVLRMAKTHVNRINISLETFDPELYARMMGVKRSYIYENLEKIGRIFPTVENAPRLCFITMVLKDNYDEILDIAQKVGERYNPLHHSFRTPYNFGVKNEYNEANLLPREKLNALELELRAKYPYAVLEFGADEVSYYGAPPSEAVPYFIFNEQYRIAVNLDGTGEFAVDRTPFDLRQIEDIPAYFAEERTRLQALRCQRPPVEAVENPADAAPLPGMQLRQVVVYEDRFLLLGADIPLEAGDKRELYWDVKINNRRYTFATDHIPPADPNRYAVERLVDLRELGIDRVRRLRVAVVIGHGGAARRYTLLKGLDKFLRLRKPLGKIRRRLGL